MDIASLNMHVFLTTSQPSGTAKQPPTLVLLILQLTLCNRLHHHHHHDYRCTYHHYAYKLQAAAKIIFIGTKKWVGDLNSLKIHTSRPWKHPRVDHIGEGVNWLPRDNSTRKVSIVKSMHAGSKGMRYGSWRTLKKVQNRLQCRNGYNEQNLFIAKDVAFLKKMRGKRQGSDGEDHLTRMRPKVRDGKHETTGERRKAEWKDCRKHTW